ncbi:hypothetical protein NT05HA_0859 [Aggregatibacter aphrophilus NJ8700]|nr:hypothetical protein NT05HA_0859 [Aggregatibacter aphrophilus NJ8700]
MAVFILRRKLSNVLQETLKKMTALFTLKSKYGHIMIKY